MKKYISILLVMLLVLCCTTVAFAEEIKVETTYFTSDEKTAKAGDEVTLPFYVKGAFANYGVYVVYPMDALELVSIDGNVTANTGTGLVGYANVFGDAGNVSSHSFTVTFKVKTDVPGRYPVSLEVDVCGDENDADVPTVVTPGAVIIEEPKCSHVYDNGVVTTPATCETDGVMTYTCTVEGCGHSYTETIAKLGHDWDEGKITTPATCKNAGVKTYTCKREGCGKTKTEEIAKLTTHTPGAEWVMDENGHWHICSVCEARCDEAGHSFEWIVDKAPTADKTGLKHEECSICHYKRNLNTSIPATGELDDVPQTNDITPQITLMAVIIAVALGAVTYIFKRKVVK